MGIKVEVYPTKHLKILLFSATLNELRCDLDKTFVAAHILRYGAFELRYYGRYAAGSAEVP